VNNVIITFFEMIAKLFCSEI